MSNSIKIGRIKGIDIELNYNWIVIFLLITYMFANYYFPTYFKDWPDWVYWAEGAFIAIMLFVSVLLHELSHSLVSMHFGIAVNKISLFIFGGTAYIEKDADTPGKEFLIAIAGPLMSLFLAAVFTVTSNILALANASEMISAPLAYIGQMNIVLAVFNLFPAMPLDGGRILTAAIWKIKKDRVYAAKIASASGTFFSYTLMMLGMLNILSGNILNGAWLIMIGVFLGQSAKASYQNSLFEKLFTGVLVKDIMTSPVVAVDMDMTASRLLKDFFFHYKHPFFPVLSEGRVAGVIMLKALKAVREEDMDKITVKQLFQPLDGSFLIAPEETAENALRRLSSNQLGRFLVMDEHGLLGILSKTDLIKYVSMYNELHS